MKISFLLFLLLFATNSQSEAIRFEHADGSVKAFSLEELKKNIPSKNVRIFNFKSRVFEEYKAFPIRDFLPYVSGERAIANDLNIKSKTGYSPIVLREHILREPGYFAYERVGGKMNTLTHRSGDLVETGPLYLVWAGQKEKDRTKGLRWVYQVEHLSYVKNEKVLLVPVTAPLVVKQGAVLYQNHCLRCHHENANAVDLLVPSVLERKKADWVAKYILNPTSINKKSTMPAYAHIFQNDNELKQVMSFLHYKLDPSSFSSKREMLQKFDDILNQASDN